MEENKTIMQLTFLISGIIRRINANPLAKAGDMRFINLKPEKRAEKGDAELHTTQNQTENEAWNKASHSTSSHTCWPRS